MAGQIPMNPKIYHIVHLDRLASIISQGCLWSDSAVQGKDLGGTMIGMSHIKQRRMTNSVSSHPGLSVGQCVPFYFCPRSIMLYIISQQSHEDISYRGGQAPIIHLQADLQAVINWAQQNNKRWAFTLSNAGASYFEDRNDLSRLNEINWNAVQANRWSGSGVCPSIKEGKQAEFLLEEQFPWALVEAVGVYSQAQVQQVSSTLNATTHRPPVSVQRNWYY